MLPTAYLRNCFVVIANAVGPREQSENAGLPCKNGRGPEGRPRLQNFGF